MEPNKIGLSSVVLIFMVFAAFSFAEEGDPGQDPPPPAASEEQNDAPPSEPEPPPPPPEPEASLQYSPKLEPGNGGRVTAPWQNNSI